MTPTQFLAIRNRLTSSSSLVDCTYYEKYTRQTSCALKTPYFAQNCVLLRIFAHFKISFRDAHNTPILVQYPIKYSSNDIFVYL